MSEESMFGNDSIEDDLVRDVGDINLVAKNSLIAKGYTIEAGRSLRRTPGEPFEPMHKIVDPNGKVLGHIPEFGFSALLAELDRPWTIHDDWLGITADDGRYVEFLLSRFGVRSYYSVIDDFVSPRTECVSAVNGEHASLFSTVFGTADLQKSRAVNPYRAQSNRAFRTVVRNHVGNGVGDCIEVSVPSARLYAIYAEHVDRTQLTSPVNLSSVKIFFRNTSPSNVATEKARNLASTFMFEQAAMRRSAMVFHEPLVERQRLRTLQRLPGDAEVRFPPQFVDSRASTLFINADRAEGKLSRYLAYYQTIEYFLPFSDERESISRLRTEIFSPGFNLGNERSLLNLVHIIGRQSSKSERESFRDLVAYSLTDEKAKGIYETVKAMYHEAFSKRDRLTGLPFIHPNDSSKSLKAQIADRIYSLRCRIVHSKAAGGSVGIEPLFATDDEVAFVDADLDLVRLVAIESVTAFATANSLV